MKTLALLVALAMPAATPSAFTFDTNSTCCPVDAVNGFSMTIFATIPAASGAFLCKWRDPRWICERSKP